MKSNKKDILMSFITSNPTFVLVIGMCPVMAQTTTLQNSLGLGIATMLCLIITNVIISALRKIIPDKVRIPAYIIIIAATVTAIDMVMAKFLPDLYKNISQSIKMIVVNCIILARAESFASSNTVSDSALDGVAIGAGFTLAVCLIGAVRELLGKWAIWGISLPGNFPKIAIFEKSIGGFLVLAIFMGIFNAVMAYIKKANAAKPQVQAAEQVLPIEEVQA